MLISPKWRDFGIGKAASALGVSITTLRHWEASGRLATEHTVGDPVATIWLSSNLDCSAPKRTRRTVAYARVSRHDQKDDLERQKQVLELYCARQG